MKWILLLSMMCIVGAASAQAIFTGEGYGSSQLAFFNGPTTTPFEPFVEKYWDSYIHNSPNLTGPMYNPATSMNIWFNNFPLDFNQPIQMKTSSFSTANASIGNLSPAEQDSMMLKRSTIGNFNIEQNWKYAQLSTPGAEKSTISLSNKQSSTATESSSSGEVISQGIRSGFSY
jgi:hypothetical protein